MTVFWRVYYLGMYETNQVNSALHPFGVAKPSTSFGCGKGGNATSARWQTCNSTPCDPIWHVELCVMQLQTAIVLYLYSA